MGTHYFQFKQFTIYHDRCAMKVGTDGVLLGAWCNIPKNGNILDIGTGTGIIALMAAQRSSFSQVSIDAIEIDRDAYLQAKENISSSPWSNKIQVINCSLQEYAEMSETLYDHIVSNPPYFDNTLPPKSLSRQMARHTASLTYEEFVSNAVKLLKPEGHISVIYPADQDRQLTGIAVSNKLWVSRKVWVKGRPNVFPKRVLVEWGKSPVSYIEEELVIETAPLTYTPEYIDLTKDFYLKM